MRIRSLAIALVLAAITPMVATAQADKKLDLTGKWTFTSVSDYGTSTPSVTFVQKGDSVTGKYSSTTIGDHDFVGTIKDRKLDFGFNAEAGGMQFYLAFSGVVDSTETIQGSTEAAGQAFGTFSAKRQPLAPAKPPTH